MRSWIWISVCWLAAMTASDAVAQRERPAGTPPKWPMLVDWHQTHFEQGRYDLAEACLETLHDAVRSGQARDPAMLLLYVGNADEGGEFLYERYGD